ncbi:hypothetical protein J7394_13790 [Ruegeria sp. R13_0]|uniref:hypothetical protein n=1 Tax=Ruegeria sp. R13_0 TaxID=2821099 RepID=UPI001AD9F91E|nr:hypothetical protein [Ruegeria sp. R13_0]MBO9435284.1 hypothetical protein [Ruegeria sp. R13_0]
MTTFSEFVQKAKDDYARVEDELKSFEQKVKDAGEATDKWTQEQVTKLQSDLQEAKDKVTDLADRIQQEGEDAVTDAHDQAKNHWEALHAAVAAYRDHLDKSVA